MINGQVNLVTNPTLFFTAVLSGSAPPPAAFRSAIRPATQAPYVVTVVGVRRRPAPEGFFINGNVNKDNGTFALEGFREGLPIDVAAISLTLNKTQFFRTQYFPVNGLDQPINLFLFQPRVPVSNAITAGQISENLQGKGLPGNTTLTSNGSGLSIAGSKEGAHIQFGVSIVPDTSFDLNLFIDLALSGWNIHVGWPADVCESANDILQKIRNDIQTSGSSVNQTVLSNIESALTSAPENLSPALAAQLLALISTQFRL